MKFVNITREDFLSRPLLYKYMPLEYTLKTLNSKRLWFADPTKWKDPFERRFVEAKYMDGTKQRNFRWKNHIYCICMSQTQVCEASWRVYSPNDIAVQLRINRDELLKELEKMEKDFDIYIGKVEYMSTNDITKDLSEIPFKKPRVTTINSDNFAARLFMLKRMAFRYEDEIRILLLDKDKKNTPKKDGVEMPYQCENTDLIHSVVIDPSIGLQTFSMIKEFFVNKYNFKPYRNGSGRSVSRVIHSEIYKNIGSDKINFYSSGSTLQTAQPVGNV